MTPKKKVLSFLAMELMILLFFTTSILVFINVSFAEEITVVNVHDVGYGEENNQITAKTVQTAIEKNLDIILIFALVIVLVFAIKFGLITFQPEKPRKKRKRSVSQYIHYLIFGNYKA